MTACWLCDRPIDDPPRVIGSIIAGDVRVAHLECVRYLGEVELQLRDDADPERQPPAA